MKSIVPISDDLEFTLQTNIQENLRGIKRQLKLSRTTLRSALHTLRTSSIQDGQKLIADVMVLYDNNISDTVTAIANVCASAIQLGNTVDLDAFEKEDIEERYYSDGYLQCFSDIYRTFNELRGQL